MEAPNSIPAGPFLHVVMLECKDHDHTTRCLAALRNQGRPDALAANCISYEFGIKEGTTDTRLYRRTLE